jgi:hypothetical protein
MRILIEVVTDRNQGAESIKALSLEIKVFKEPEKSPDIFNPISVKPRWSKQGGSNVILPEFFRY